MLQASICSKIFSIVHVVNCKKAYETQNIKALCFSENIFSFYAGLNVTCYLVKTL